MTDAREHTLSDGRRVRIRPSSVSDAEGAVEVDRALAKDGRGMVLSLDQVRSVDEERQRIDQMYAGIPAGSASLLVVAETVGDQTAIIANAELQQLYPERCRHVGILSVGVHPSFQRHGIGRMLMLFLIDHATTCELSRLELYVRADNSRARALYESLGFAHEGTRRRFVRLDSGKEVDDLIMVRFLE